MRETRFQPGLLLRRLAALVLVAWLAGLGCLLGCEGPAAVAAAAPSSESHAEAAQSCAAMSSGHGCCHAAKARAGATAAGTPARHGGPAADCPLDRQTSDPARKVRASDDAPAAAHAAPQSHDFRPPSFSQSYSPIPRAQDRGGTYLRCCVFLI